MLINYATFNLNRAPSLPVSKTKKFLLSFAYNSFFFFHSGALRSKHPWKVKKHKRRREKSDVNGLLGGFLKRTETTLTAGKILLARKSVNFFLSHWPFFNAQCPAIVVAFFSILTVHITFFFYKCWIVSVSMLQISVVASSTTKFLHK